MYIFSFCKVKDNIFLFLFCYVTLDKKFEAEIKLLLGKIARKESFRSFQNFITSLQSAIPDSEILKAAKLSRTKANYLITDGLGPFFREKMLQTITNSNNLFSLLFDETTNAKKLKELVIKIRFFSEENQQVN